ncbi:MAG: hypothetical protein GY756_16405 [bacterium]|nr:hypothetical protein [bacterium]
MFQIKTCLAITWDKKGYVYAIKCSKAKHSIKILKPFSLNDEALSLSEKLSNTFNTINGISEERIILGGYIPTSLTFDIEVPSLAISDITQFLNYELSRYVPYSIDDLKWCFRPIKYSKNNKKIEKVKIFAVKHTEWEKIINSITEAGIKIDCFSHPFLSVDPLFNNMDLYMSGLDEKFYLKSLNTNEEEYSFCNKLHDNNVDKEESDIWFKTRYGHMLGENWKNFIPAIILARYCFEKNFSQDIKYGLELPKTLYPKRFRHLKILAALLTVVFIIMLGFYITRSTMDNNAVINKLLWQKNQLSSALENLKDRELKMKKTNTAINELINAEPNDINLLGYLNYFSENIPKTVWVTNINTYQDKINLTLKTNSSSENLLSQFYKSDLFTLENNRRRKTSDGTEYIYMTLQKKNTTKTIESL